ncbi:MAG: hypothetical protein HY660_06015 [Armatimonadetes bacterium]|nr:hypothetical protein [Armatimonadota bacterium]
MSEGTDPVRHLSLSVPEEDYLRVPEVIRAQRWGEEEGVRILLAYALEALRPVPPETVKQLLGAARGELAQLRHRAFLADDAMQTLEMNVTGLTASIDQFHRSIASMQRQVDSLRAALGEPAGEVIEVGDPGTHEEVSASKASLFRFFTSTRQSGGRTRGKHE